MTVMFARVSKKFDAGRKHYKSQAAVYHHCLYIYHIFCPEEHYCDTAHDDTYRTCY